MSKFKRAEIEKEYNEAAKSLEEFEMVKWGSEEKMNSRFNLVIECLDFNSIIKWLDVGSGTGKFQEVVKSKFPQVEAVGIDISNELIKYSSSKSFFKQFENIKFYKKDFLEFEESEFDLLTSIGVLQKTNIPLKDFFIKAYKILKKNGILFLDTKNINWEEFSKPEFFPEDSHDWFEVKELEHYASLAGFKNITTQGFIPGESRIVKANQSHTIFLTATK